RVELGDIETHLRRLDGVHDAIVIPHYRDSRLDALRAFIVLADAQAPRDFPTASRLRQALAESLPAPMVPQHIHFVAAIPMTAHGKAHRKRLGQMPMRLVSEAW